MAYGTAYQNADPVAAYDVLRRALTVARESGNRQLESGVAVTLCMLAAIEGNPLFGATGGDPIDAFDYLTVTVRRYHDAGSVSLLPIPLGILAVVFDRLGHHKEAATISGFAETEMTRVGYSPLNTAIARLRDVLGDQTYESLARRGKAMTTAGMVAYAYDQIDEARAELNAVSK
jgi:hypothetical protein